MNSEIFDKLPFELQNEVYKYVGKHKIADIINDLIDLCICKGYDCDLTFRPYDVAFGPECRSVFHF